MTDYTLPPRPPGLFSIAGRFRVFFNQSRVGRYAGGCAGIDFLPAPALSIHDLDNLIAELTLIRQEMALPSSQP